MADVAGTRLPRHLRLDLDAEDAAEPLRDLEDGHALAAADVDRLAGGAVGDEREPARAYDVPAVALRFFNVYGTRQALSNPYTGVLAIFASRLLNARPPLVFEDGHQRRDFVAVGDVARACRLALERPDADGRVLNVGSGRSVTVLEIFDELRLALEADAEVEVTRKARAGDIRHCFADISLARELLGFRPQVELGDGLRDLAGWLEGQVAEDRVDAAAAELATRGLTL